jgi:hypothetical protein
VGSSVTAAGLRGAKPSGEALFLTFAASDTVSHIFNMKDCLL